MIKQCPKCGAKIMVNGLGRKPLNIPFENVLNALQSSSTVRQGIEMLKSEFGQCSVGYVYKQCQLRGLKPREIVLRKSGDL